MDKEKILSMINETVSPASGSGSMGDEGRVWIRDGENVWQTVEGASLSALKPGDIISVSAGNADESTDKLSRLAALIMKKYPQVNVLLLNSSPYSKTVSMTGEVLKPYVDDIAQMIGIDIKNLPLHSTGKILKQFRKRSAVTLAGRGILCAGSSMDDAMAAAIITEKAAYIHILGSFIGKIKFIGAVESALMRSVYLEKYSKQASAAGRE